MACAETGALDPAKLQPALDDVASRPDVSTLDRAIIERFMALFGLAGPKQS